MSIITERLSKLMFLNKGLDKKLIEELKQHLGNPNLGFKISWYNGCDINHIRSYEQFLDAKETISMALDVEKLIKYEVEYALDKILSKDIIVFVCVYSYDSQKSKLNKSILLDYKVPNDGYRFDKDLGKWMYGKSLDEITKSYNPMKDNLRETAIMLYILLMVIVALLPTIIGVCLSELNHEPCYMMFLVLEIPLIPSVWILNTKIWIPFLKLIGYTE